jgi:hypothetical protein
MTVYKIGDRVGLDPDLSSTRFRNVVFEVVKVNPKTLKLRPLNGGQLVNADKFLIVPPATTVTDVPLPEDIPIVQHLVCGTVVRVTGINEKPGGWLHNGDLGTVLVDKGDRVNVAPLGGFEDRYARLPHHCLTVVPRSALAEKPF